MSADGPVALLMKATASGRRRAGLARCVAAGLAAVAVLAGCGTPHAPVTPGVVKVVAGYLLEAADLEVVTPPGFAAAIENGNEPSTGDTAQMFQLITSHRTKVLMYNAQAQSPVTEQVRALARQYGVPVVPVTETMPSSSGSYQAWQLAQATALLGALGG